MSDQTRILCVDDERNVLRSLERIFLDDDFVIITATSGEEGLELLDSSPQVQVVISDFRMPGMNGVEFLKKVCLKCPDTIRIVLSGYADTAAVVAAINEGKIYKFIPKPWNDDELRMTVVKALEHFTSNRHNERLAEELRLRNEELRRLNATLEELVEARSSELAWQNRALVYARNVLNHLPFGVIGISAEGRLQQINREAALLLGISPARVLGEPAATVLPPELCRVVEETAQASYSCKSVPFNGQVLEVLGVTMVEDGEAGSILTIMKTQGAAA